MTEVIICSHKVLGVVGKEGKTCEEERTRRKDGE